MMSRAKSLRCVVVDDHTGFLDAAAKLLECQGVTIVGVATTSAEARLRVAELQPDVILVDVDLGEESGFELTEQLVQAGKTSPRRVILISARDECDLTDMIDASSAVGFLPKSTLSCKAIEQSLRSRDESDS